LNLRPSGYERKNCPDRNLRPRPDLRVSPSAARISRNPHVAHAVHDVRQIMDNLGTRQATVQDHTLLPNSVQGFRGAMAGEHRGTTAVGNNVVHLGRWYAVQLPRIPLNMVGQLRWLSSQPLAHAQRGRDSGGLSPGVDTGQPRQGDEVEQGGLDVAAPVIG